MLSEWQVLAGKFLFCDSDQNSRPWILEGQHFVIRVKFRYSGPKDEKKFLAKRAWLTEQYIVNEEFYGSLIHLAFAL